MGRWRQLPSQRRCEQSLQSKLPQIQPPQNQFEVGFLEPVVHGSSLGQERSFQFRPGGASLSDPFDALQAPSVRKKQKRVGRGHRNVADEQGDECSEIGVLKAEKHRWSRCASAKTPKLVQCDVQRDARETLHQRLDSVKPLGRTVPFPFEFHFVIRQEECGTIPSTNRCETRAGGREGIECWPRLEPSQGRRGLTPPDSSKLRKPPHLDGQVNQPARCFGPLGHGKGRHRCKIVRCHGGHHQGTGRGPRGWSSHQCGFPTFHAVGDPPPWPTSTVTFSAPEFSRLHSETRYHASPTVGTPDHEKRTSSAYSGL